jgi:hypothetical protein
MLMLSFLVSLSSASAELPEWYTANRIHYHWENTAANLEEKGSVENWIQWLTGVHKVVAESGAKVTVTAGRHSAEGAWWPTAVGEPFAGFGTNDILRDAVIGDYQARGLKTIIYYRHDIDYAMQDAHPEWLARNADGSPVEKNRGANVYGRSAFQMCQNSPFREFTRQRLVEIFERGANGVYFDEDHMPDVCFCENCKAAFKVRYGRSLPVDPQPGTAEYLEVARFVGDTLADTFSEWKSAVQRINPQAVLLVSAEQYGQMTGVHMNDQTARSGSANKTEFQKCFGGQQHFPQAPIRLLKAAHPDFWLPPRDLQESLAWMISRDVLNGRPPHVWVYKPNPDVEGEVLHTASAVVAHGGIAGMSLAPSSKYQTCYQKLFAMNDALAPVMAHARPYSWAVVHVSETLKDRCYLEGGSNADVRYRHQFEHFYAPVLGASAALRKAHLPFATVSDTALKLGIFAPETQVLLVPSYDLLPADLRQGIDSSGLRVVRLSGDWHLDAAREGLQQDLLTRLGTPPVSVEGPDHLVATYMINETTGNLLVSLVRDWNWFWIHGIKEGQIWSEERLKQPAIENVMIRAPGTQMVIYPAGEETGMPIDICRFIEIRNAEQ